MPFTSRIVTRPVVRWALYLRANPLAAYAMSVCGVALATAIRWMVGPESGLPFLTYFPTVTVVGLLGGAGPGVLAALLSGGVGVSLFAPTYEWGASNPYVMTLLLFWVACGFKLVVITLLHQALDELVEQERNVRQLVEAVPVGIIVAGEDGSIGLANEAAQSLFGYEAADLLGKSVDVLVPDDLRHLHQRHRLQFLARPQARVMGNEKDLSGVRKDGSRFDAEIGLSPLMRGSRVSVVATVVDVSERRRALEKERFLLRELHHRIQNMFAVIQAIVRRTLQVHPDRNEAEQLLLSRIHALAEAQRVLLYSVWEGADLRKMIEVGVGAFTTRMEIRGVELTVNRDAAQQLALIFHELTTNSLKYGALSADGGGVSIIGQIDRKAGTFELSWREMGGPSVLQPTRQGFGSTLLTQAAKQFADDVRFEYQPSGLQYVLRMRLDRVEYRSSEMEYGQDDAVSLP
jgi:PAS domain S-box-containing protein